jgi:hypothetical protein
MTHSSSFLDALPSPQRSPELADADDLFGWLIGSWDVDAVLHDAKHNIEKRRGEVHASWVLEGRAIQDLFIFPRRIDRHSGIPTHGDRYATTLRTYDRTRRAWRIIFIDPAADETSAQLLARRNGDEIVMEGNLSDGTPIRWRYDEFTPESFHYIGEKPKGDSASWQVYLELFGK